MVSIWCSHETIGWEHGGQVIYADGRTAYEAGRFEGGEVRTYASGFSNHYPTRDDEHELPATVELASIAPWCVPGHEDADYPNVGEWLRLSVHASNSFDFWGPGGERRNAGPMDADVVLDESAARALRDQLDEWLARPRLTTEESA